MALIVYTDPFLTIGGVNMTQMARSLGLNLEGAELDANHFGIDWEEVRGGLKSWEVTVEFNQDFAAGQVDATLWPLFNTLAAVVIRPTSAAVSATNPQWSGNVLVNSYTPLDGDVGNLVQVSFTWPGSGALTRATA